MEGMERGDDERRDDGGENIAHVRLSTMGLLYVTLN